MIDQKTRRRIERIEAIIDPSSGATAGERDAAKAALERILAKRPTNKYNIGYSPSTGFSWQTMTIRDLYDLKMSGGSLAGQWTGGTMQDAIGQMLKAYGHRMGWGTRSHRPPVSKADYSVFFDEEPLREEAARKWWKGGKNPNGK